MISILRSKNVLIGLICCFIVIAVIDVIIPGRAFFPDENVYIREAKSIAETGQFKSGFYRAHTMPFNGMIYAIFYKIFGEGILFIKSVRVLQAFIHILTAIGAAAISFSVFRNKTTALIVLFSMIIYPSLLAYQCMLMTETFFIFFLVWGFAFLFLWERGATPMFVYATLTFMLSLYVRPVITTLMPVLIGVRCLVLENFWRNRIKFVILSCAIFIVCMSPWWIRNWSVFGEFVPFAPSSGNLYLGNNPVNKTAGIDWSTDVDQEVVSRINSSGDELLISKEYMKEAKKYIVENKAIFLRNMWLKFKRFWNFTSNYKGEKYSTAFRLYNLSLLLSWGVACPLGIVSVFLNRKKWRELLPIYLLIIYYTFIHTVVIASIRYRLPIEPFFIIMGADCVFRIYNKMIQRNEKE
ncbi:MAG: hypothetical protein LBQ58_00510 [Synergistaceae bacterium]|jgi:hypothetical protein|nr:hypothetical protein [Synergistaceae bacterium]